MSNFDMSDALSLRSLIKYVQDELIASQSDRERRGNPPLFEVQELTIEASFVVTQSSDKKGGISLKVLTIGRADIGGSITSGEQNTHKLTIKMKALKDSRGRGPLPALP